MTELTKAEETGNTEAQIQGIKKYLSAQKHFALVDKIKKERKEFNTWQNAHDLFIKINPNFWRTQTDLLQRALLSKDEKEIEVCFSNCKTRWQKLMGIYENTCKETNQLDSKSDIFFQNLKS